MLSESDKASLSPSRAPHRAARVHAPKRPRRSWPTSRPGARSSSPSCRPSSAPGTSTAASRRAPCCASSTTRTTIATRCGGWRATPRLVSLVQSLIGPGVSVYFSQIFFKPPEGGGPKPAHQDNFYFGPTDLEGVVTAWIALDDATLENGCLYFGDGTNRGPVYAHDGAARRAVQPAAAGRDPRAPADGAGAGDARRRRRSTTATRSTSRGRTTAGNWRRACALHYVRNDVEFANPALPYDHALKLRVT